MKKLLAIIITAFALLGCTKDTEDLLVGDWTEVNSGIVLTFYKNGNGMMGDRGFSYRTRTNSYGEEWLWFIFSENEEYGYIIEQLDDEYLKYFPKHQPTSVYTYKRFSR